VSVGFNGLKLSSRNLNLHWLIKHLQ